MGDIKKAHRRFKEQGFLACQLDTREGPAGQLDESCVYINKVGTFGVNCASYWWTRVAACGIGYAPSSGEAIPGAAICLVDDTHHAEGPL